MIQRLRHSRAARNAAASYLAFASTSASMLFAIPLAVHYLDKEEIGLWSVMQVVVGYLLLLDLGVGQATGRKIADAIARNDEQEINRWWTLTIGVLVVQGMVMAVAALACAPFIPFLFGITEVPLQQQSSLLFLGLALLMALGMPSRAYPGILLAQERFHWVPLTQAMMPWIQMSVFWLLLSMGLGIWSYLWSQACANISGWVLYLWQVHGKGLKLSIDTTGFTRKRFADLFHYSGNLALSGIAASIMGSIPSMLLAKLGGLSLVPVFNFSQRPPKLITSLAQRTSHSFTPNLQRLFVSGDRERFRSKFRNVNQLTVWISLGTAAVILGFNRSFICWLADTDFYSGHWANLWFACGCLTAPFQAMISSMLHYSGNMGKSAFFSFLQILVALPMAWLGYTYFQLAGIAFVFAFVSLVTIAPYAWIRGSKNCGFSGWDLCGSATILFLSTLGIVMAAGLWILGDDSKPVEWMILGRDTILPTLREITASVVIGTIAGIGALRQARIIQRS